ncbi:MAG: M23 family metallopeptidase [Candidatus Omnitrophota bacterium]
MPVVKPMNVSLKPVVPTPVIEKSVKVVNQVGKGDTIISVLTTEGLMDRDLAYRFFTEVKSVYDLKQICSGKKYTLYFSPDHKALERFQYEIDPARTLNVVKDKKRGVWHAEIKTVLYEKKDEFVSGEIKESLFGAIVAAGEKPELADSMASLYEYDIDFNRDIQKKDRFNLIVEKLYLNGQFIKYGNILSAEFTNRGKTLQVLRFTDPEGKTAYYQPDGKSIKKMFLRCPLPFMHVTSSYGNRMHPLLGYSAQHNGIDLGAPSGTPIKATASGIVREAGRSGSRGNFVLIEHPNHYISHYYHMSRISSGVKVGKRVDQSQVIGFVGSTGWSTGPHLHYGMQKSGSFLNPLRLNSPTTEPVKDIYFPGFKLYASRVFLLMSGSKLVKIPPVFTEEFFKAIDSRKVLPMPNGRRG